jgi:hypothetical protein
LNTSAPATLAAAIRLQSCQNVSCERVYFSNCPEALFIDNGSLQCGLFNCTIDYGNFGATMNVTPTMVTLSGSENYIDHCVIRQVSQDPHHGGPAGCIAVVAATGGGGIYITNSHLSHFTTGIRVQGGGNENIMHLNCSNLVCECWTNALIIKPLSSSGMIFQVRCDDCAFSRATESTDTSSIGVIIDTAGGGNGNVSDIFLNNCICFAWNGPGVQINSGQNIVITGGRYGSNATSASNSGGIDITGLGAQPAANVTISGADLTVRLPNPAFGSQPFAMSITAAVAGLYVRGCNLTGYVTNGPLHLSSPGTQIEITDCAGYNDLATVLTPSGATPPSGQFQNYSSWTNAPSGWFGPIAFYVWGSGVTSVHIDNVPMALSTGGFTLSPGEHASIDVGPLTTPSFMAVGK